jgi:hypothetical protein
MKKPYDSPTLTSEDSFETSALACAKTADPPPGSHHFYASYDTFTGHFGPGMAIGGYAHESSSGSAGVGFGTWFSGGYNYSGLCINWVTLAT